MAKADYYKGLDAHFTEREYQLQKKAHQEHGSASMHPVDAMRFSHDNETKAQKMTVKRAAKLGRLKVVKKSK